MIMDTFPGLLRRKLSDKKDLAKDSDPTETKIQRPVSQRAKECASRICKAWIYYNKSLIFKKEVDLIEIILSFSYLMRQFVKEEYPDLYSHPRFPKLALFWACFLDGIRLSHYPSKEQLKTAIPEFIQKYL